jgi:hypothetical protein
MLISYSNSSKVITTPRFDESDVLLMAGDGDVDGLSLREGSEMEVRRRCQTK